MLKRINTPKDLELFRLSLIGNDYTMYKIILSCMDNFKSAEKGKFLTNTRHAYKGIKNRKNNYYWNCGTFFYFHHPEKTYSVHFHNINLSFQGYKKLNTKTPKTTEGLESISVSWVRMENGLWDSAFKLFGNIPVAFDLKDTPFGRAKYRGQQTRGYEELKKGYNPVRCPGWINRQLIAILFCAQHPFHEALKTKDRDKRTGFATC